jgi:hypothetical protein
MKELFQEVKKMFWPLMFVLIIGFSLGKVYTYASISMDCKVLGMFRITDTAYGCRVSAP